jgi:hypothetical protein
MTTKRKRMHRMMAVTDFDPETVVASGLAPPQSAIEDTPTEATGRVGQRTDGMLFHEHPTFDPQIGNASDVASQPTPFLSGMVSTVYKAVRLLSLHDLIPTIIRITNITFHHLHTNSFMHHINISPLSCYLPPSFSRIIHHPSSRSQSLHITATKMSCVLSKASIWQRLLRLWERPHRPRVVP